MPKYLVNWLVTSLVILMIPYIFPGIHVSGLGAALATAAVLGILNLLVRPILILLTLPITILSFGLFLLLINTAMLMLAAKIVEGFYISSFWSAFGAALAISVAHWLTSAQMARPRLQFRFDSSRGPGHAGDQQTASRRRSNTIDLEDKGGTWQ